MAAYIIHLLAVINISSIRLFTRTSFESQIPALQSNPTTAGGHQVALRHPSADNSSTWEWHDVWA